MLTWISVRKTYYRLCDFSRSNPVPIRIHMTKHFLKFPRYFHNTTNILLRKPQQQLIKTWLAAFSSDFLSPLSAIYTAPR